jgi:1,4-alpha-glucan branching enzyme
MRHKVPTNAKGAASIHRMPFGAQLLPDGAVRFRLWAPACETVSVEIAGRATPLDRRRGRA